MDGRRRQWVPIASDLAWTRTARLLADKFGSEGPFVWVLVLLASKRSLNQGRFQFLSEADGWNQLGWDLMGLERPSFTLREFFAYTGKIKRTRKSDRYHVDITSWERWNREVNRDQRAKQSTRKRAKNKTHDTHAIAPTDLDLDLDSEREGLYRATTPEELAQNAAAAKRLTDQLAGRLRSP